MPEPLGSAVSRSQLATACAYASMAGPGAASRERSDGHPAEGSPAAQDVAGHPNGMEAASHVMRLALRWTEGAANMLGGLGALLDWGHTTDAPEPIYRAVLEHTSRVTWLLDAPTTQARIHRAWVAWLACTADDTATADADVAGQGAMAGAPGRLDGLIRRIPEVLGVEANLGREGRSTHTADYQIGEERFGRHTSVAAEFIDRYFERDGRVAYRVYTTLAHPTTSGAFAFAEESEGSMTVQAPVAHVRGATLSVLHLWRVAAGRCLQYMGWEDFSPYHEWSSLLRALTEAHHLDRDVVIANAAQSPGSDRPAPE